MSWSRRYILLRMFIHYPLAMLPVALLLAYMTEPDAACDRLMRGTAAWWLVAATAALPAFTVQELASPRRSLCAYAAMGAAGLAWAPAVMMMLGPRADFALYPVMAALLGALAGAVFWRLGVRSDGAPGRAQARVPGTGAKEVAVRLLVHHPLSALPAFLAAALGLIAVQSSAHDSAGPMGPAGLAILAAIIFVLILPGHALLTLAFPRRSPAFYTAVGALSLLLVTVVITLIVTWADDGVAGLGALFRNLTDPDSGAPGGFLMAAAVAAGAGAISAALFWCLARTGSGVLTGPLFRMLGMAGPGGWGRATVWKEERHPMSEEVFVALLWCAGAVGLLYGGIFLYTG